MLILLRAAALVHRDGEFSAQRRAAVVVHPREQVVVAVRIVDPYRDEPAARQGRQFRALGGRYGRGPKQEFTGHGQAVRTKDARGDVLAGGDGAVLLIDGDDEAAVRQTHDRAAVLHRAAEVFADVEGVGPRGRPVAGNRLAGDVVTLHVEVRRGGVGGGRLVDVGNNEAAVGHGRDPGVVLAAGGGVGDDEFRAVGRAVGVEDAPDGAQVRAAADAVIVPGGDELGAAREIGHVGGRLFAGQGRVDQDFRTEGRGTGGQGRGGDLGRVVDGRDVDGLAEGGGGAAVAVRQGEVDGA